MLDDNEDPDAFVTRLIRKVIENRPIRTNEEVTRRALECYKENPPGELSSVLGLAQFAYKSSMDDLIIDIRDIAEEELRLKLPPFESLISGEGEDYLTDLIQRAYGVVLGHIKEEAPPLEAITDFRGEYRWLSNYEASPVEYKGVMYPSVEHAYQAAKTKDSRERQAILECKTCKEARLLGQKVTLRDQWETMRVTVMRGLVSQKFEEHKELQDKLLATGSRSLIEGNDWGDTFWGVCKGEGENQLGKILMKLRDEIRYNLDAEND